MRDLDDINIESIYLESFNKIKSFVGIGAALMGSPSNANISPDNLAELWSKYYQTSNNIVNTKRASQVISAFDIENIPNSSKNAISIAVYIFGGDMGVSRDVLEHVLIYTGAIESNYSTKVQRGGGPAKSYWQVEPETAIDLLLNSRPLFGNKFKKIFGKNAEILLNIRDKTPENLKIVGNMIEQDDRLGACFAAVKWLASAGKELKNYE